MGDNPGGKTESSMGKCGCQNALNAKTEEESCQSRRQTRNSKATAISMRSFR
jgi:hypothetical protein